MNRWDDPNRGTRARREGCPSRPGRGTSAGTWYRSNARVLPPGLDYPASPSQRLRHSVLDLIVDLEARTGSARSGLLVHPAHSGDRMVWVGVVSGRFVNAGNPNAHDRMVTWKVPVPPAVTDTWHRNLCSPVGLLVNTA